jgi:DNA polymerase-4
MTTMLLASVVVPRLLVQLAMMQLAARSPLAVIAHDEVHAPVLECCAHATRLGVTTGMPAGVVYQNYPQVNLVTLTPSIIDTARATIEAVLSMFGDNVSAWSSTGWLVELRALGTNYTHARRETAYLRQALLDATGLHITLGLAPRRIVAQVAAREAVARGERSALIILPGEETAFLTALPLERMPHVGARTVERLALFGIVTIGQLAALPVATALEILGPRGARLHQQARGIDVTRLPPIDDGLESSWSYARAACADVSQLHRHVRRLTERVGRRLRSQGQAAGSITVRVHWVDGREQQRSQHFPARYDLDSELALGSHAALATLLEQRRLAVRELMVSLHDIGSRQGALFEVDPRLVQRQNVLDQIKQRHGTSAILLAWMLSSAPPPTT